MYLKIKGTVLVLPNFHLKIISFITYPQKGLKGVNMARII